MIQATPPAAYADAPPCERPGYCYMSAGKALQHAALKSLMSAGVYGGLRAAHVSKLPAALISTLGVLAVGKAIEAAKSHHIPLGDLAHDAAWHSLLTVPIALGNHPWEAGLSVGGLGAGILLTRKFSSPRW